MIFAAALPPLPRPFLFVWVGLLRLSAVQTEAQLDCALDLMRRLPPQNIEENLAGLIDLVGFVVWVWVWGGAGDW